MASKIAEYLKLTQMCLKVSQEFYEEWHEDDYTELKENGYMEENLNSQVIVMTVGSAIIRYETRGHFRPFLIFL